jgi:hypothetical protein
VGPMGPTTAVMSYHRHVLKVSDSPFVTGGTYIPPATPFYIIWSPSWRGSSFGCGDGRGVVVGPVGPTTAFLAYHIHILKYIVSPVVTYIPPATPLNMFCNPFLVGLQKICNTLTP